MCGFCEMIGVPGGHDVFMGQLNIEPIGSPCPKGDVPNGPLMTIGEYLKQFATTPSYTAGAGISIEGDRVVQAASEQRTFATLAAAYIMSDLVPEWEQQFEARNAEYGEYDNELGTLGEAIEIYRKAKKLKRAFINRVDTTDWKETPREVAMDMIGHLFLLIMLLDEKGAGDKPGVTFEKYDRPEGSV